MQRTRALFLYLILFLIIVVMNGCSSFAGNHDDDLPLFDLVALQTKSISGLSGTITVYNLAGTRVAQNDLIFTADKIYAPRLHIPKNDVYRLILVFYYDDNLPIAFLDEDITVGAEDSYNFVLNKENIHFDMSEISNPDVFASLSLDVDSGLLPDLDLDDDGYNNLVEYRGGSDPRDANSIPSGPVFESVDVEYADDGNLVTITAAVRDGNYVTSVDPSVSNLGYLQHGGIFDADLLGDDLDKSRIYTLNFNPQYAPEGDITLILTATNSIGLTSADSTTLTITDNGVNVGPVIVFDSLSADDVVGGDVEVVMTSYDRDTVTTLELLSPTSIHDTASEAAYFVGQWDTTSQDDGDFTVTATAEDLLGKSTTRRLSISINNGTDGSGPGLQINIYKPGNSGATIDYLNGETVYGIAHFVVVANDASEVSYIQLQNPTELNCIVSDMSECPLVNRSNSIESFQTNSSAYSNSFDTTLYNDGTLIEMRYYSTDSHGSSRNRTFSFTIQNAPTINTVSISSTSITGGGELTVRWGVEDRTTRVYLLDSYGTTITCAEGEISGNDGSCTFTPTESQKYTVRAAYTANDQYGVAHTFYSNSQTSTVNLDYDADGVFDQSDNCYKTSSSNQTDTDGDGFGDLCDPDQDGDGYADAGFDFETFYNMYVGSAVTESNQAYATLYTQSSYVGINDCDDTNDNKNSGLNEMLNGTDDNCDDAVDEFDFSDDEAFDFLRDEEGSNIFEITGEGSYDRFGTDIQNIGDFDGDGIDDFAISAEKVQTLNGSDATEFAGAVYIYLGPLDFTQGQVSVNTTQPDLTIYGLLTPKSQYSSASSTDIIRKDDAFGDRMSTIAAGDFDGDGFNDLVLGAKGASEEKMFGGRITVIWGNQPNLFHKYNDAAAEEISVDELFKGSGSQVDLAMNIYCNFAYHFFGASLAMKDINGDNKAEIVVGSPFLVSEMNLTYGSSTYYGPDDAYLLPTYPSSSSSATLGTGTQKTQFFVIFGPDFENDRCQHYCEFMIGGTSFTNLAGGTTQPNMRVIKMSSESTLDHLGTAVKFVGDVDGDGVEELAVAAPYSDAGATNGGAVYLFSTDAFHDANTGVFPSINTLTDILVPSELNYSYKIVGTTTNEKLGSGNPSSITFGSSNSISSADLDGDGLQDLILGAPYYNSGEGKVVVFSGNYLAAHFGETLDSSDFSNLLISPASSSYFGRAVEVCDLNHDGVDEVLVGAPYYQSSHGGVFAFDGNDFDLGSINLSLETLDITFAEFYGQASTNLLGKVMRCSDLDGDGVSDDLIISEPQSEIESINTGAVFFIKNDYE